MLEQEIQKTNKLLEQIVELLSGSQPAPAEKPAKPASKPEKPAKPAAKPEKPAAKPAAEEAEEFSLEDVRLAVSSYFEKHGKNETVAMLGRYNASSVSDLDPVTYPDIMGEIKDALQAEAS